MGSKEASQPAMQTPGEPFNVEAIVYFFRRRAGGDTLDAGEASLQSAREQVMGIVEVSRGQAWAWGYFGVQRQWRTDVLGGWP